MIGTLQSSFAQAGHVQELADERGGSEPGVSQEVGPIKTASDI